MISLRFVMLLTGFLLVIFYNSNPVLLVLGAALMCGRAFLGIGHPEPLVYEVSDAKILCELASLELDTDWAEFERKVEKALRR